MLRSAESFAYAKDNGTTPRVSAGNVGLDQHFVLFVLVLGNLTVIGESCSSLKLPPEPCADDVHGFDSPAPWGWQGWSSGGLY